MTDGYENASHEYDRDKIYALIKEKEAQGWTFAYLGADQDAWEIGQQMGIPGASTMAYAGTPKGTIRAMRSMSAATVSYAASGGVQSDSFFGPSDPAPPKPKQAPSPRASRRGQRPRLRDW
jgi:hypothetical protein